MDLRYKVRERLDAILAHWYKYLIPHFGLSSPLPKSSLIPSFYRLVGHPIIPSSPHPLIPLSPHYPPLNSISPLNKKQNIPTASSLLAFHNFSTICTCTCIFPSTSTPPFPPPPLLPIPIPNPNNTHPKTVG